MREEGIDIKKMDAHFDPEPRPPLTPETMMAIWENIESLEAQIEDISSFLDADEEELREKGRYSIEQLRVLIKNMEDALPRV